MIEMVIASFRGMEALDFVIVNQGVESNDTHVLILNIQKLLGWVEQRNPDPNRLG
jgi:hypothetical protein